MFCVERESRTRETDQSENFPTQLQLSWKCHRERYLQCKTSGSYLTKKVTAHCSNLKLDKVICKTNLHITNTPNTDLKRKIRRLLFHLFRLLRLQSSSQFPLPKFNASNNSVRISKCNDKQSCPKIVPKIFKVLSKCHPKNVDAIAIEIYLSNFEERIVILVIYLLRTTNLCDLSPDKSIVIKPAGKGSRVVVWDREDNLNEAENHLSDSYLFILFI